MRKLTPCPCQSGVALDDCCRPFHLGLAFAPTAERLMRSRYCAFAVRDEAYLLRTWHSRTRPSSIDLDPRIAWCRLQILARTGGGLLDSTGTVEFVAGYRLSGKAGEQRENSRFLREDGQWLYLGTSP